MKIAYFDCSSGVSGDMILGALLDSGLRISKLKSELSKLKIAGYKIKAKKTIRCGISGTKFIVDITEMNIKRKLKDIVKIVNQSQLHNDIKDKALKIFKELAAIEARIHRKNIKDIYFHELGGLDSIIDVIGSLIGIKTLGIEAVYSSTIQVGRDFAPATVELLKGLPIYSKGIEAELTTPTGAIILKTISKDFGEMPEMKVQKVGYGAGTYKLSIPNLLRLYIGETNKDEYEKDEILLIETNIDNLNSQILAYACENLLKQGALDVFTTPIFMKKNRPGICLSVLTTPDRFDKILSTVFSEIPTLGVRIHHLQRRKLSRETISIKTRFGKVKIKISRLRKQVKNLAPEYEDCKKIAQKYGIALKDIYEEVKETSRKVLKVPLFLKSS